MNNEFNAIPEVKPGQSPDEFIKHVQQTALSVSRESDWQVGDVLLIDNVAVLHGRRPFTGDRRILVAMSD